MLLDYFSLEYSSGDTHDYPFRDVDGYRKKLKELERKRRQLEEEKLAKSKELRALLENKGEKHTQPEKQEIRLEVVEVRQEVKAYQVDLLAIRTEIKKLRREIRDHELLSRRARDNMFITMELLTMH